MHTCPLWAGSNSMRWITLDKQCPYNIWNLQEKTAKLNSVNLHVSCLLWAGSVNFISMGLVVRFCGSLWLRRSWSLSSIWSHWSLSMTSDRRQWPMGYNPMGYNWQCQIYTCESCVTQYHWTYLEGPLVSFLYPDKWIK